jgi:hypothetical protein
MLNAELVVSLNKSSVPNKYIHTFVKSIGNVSNIAGIILYEEQTIILALHYLSFENLCKCT